jgi:hypothetical protein
MCLTHFGPLKQAITSESEDWLWNNIMNSLCSKNDHQNKILCKIGWEKAISLSNPKLLFSPNQLVQRTKKPWKTSGKPTAMFQTSCPHSASLLTLKIQNVKFCVLFFLFAH